MNLLVKAWFRRVIELGTSAAGAAVPVRGQVRETRAQGSGESEVPDIPYENSEPEYSESRPLFMHRIGGKCARDAT